MAFMQEADLDDVPSIAIYHKIALTYLENENADHYMRLMELLDKYGDRFPKEEVLDMYTHALNYCVARINAGHLNFSQEMLSVYKVLINKELIYENGYITLYDIKNIVTVALRVGDLDWTENFMHEYKERIAPEYRESVYTYNLANIHYHKKEFSKALKLLQAVEINDIYYNLGAKVLLLKTYFELDEAEPFYSLVDAFTNYLKRNKLISESNRTVTLNFVKYTKKLMQMRLGSKTLPDEVRQELSGLNEVANLQWLLEKLDGMQQARA
jgi:tetratricopeptide (TPR) repeat protein